jgi:uncharacterized small protein (DUF1192 family)
MDLPDESPRPGDPLQLLLRQDLDSLSVDELAARAAALEEEVRRTRTKMEGAVKHRATAEALFR